MAEDLLALVVDDERNVRFFLQETLARSGFKVTTASSGEEALDILRDTRFDLALLDLRLGGRVDGLRLLGTVRWRWPQTAVVILTAHGTLDSALEAIREGVDGYLLKPVEPAELRQVIGEAIERRRALARPERVPEQRTLQHGPLLVDLPKHLVTRDGVPVDLGPQEFKLLVHLMQNAGRVLSAEELVRIVRDYDPDSRYEAREIIKWYVHQLRRKIEPDPARPRLVLNVRGVGYTLGE
ncbi:MAG TPA: response regulator transcription factor [Anaerolineae bacterium]|nr:response regulator transcription factor [Anaerolineae bacterium]HOQ99214.1 response regulator transcription factor [Anaerolineae bacterium]HPL28824.1 response regulator transcription factor [Anaerolineae bacterium]